MTVNSFFCCTQLLTYFPKLWLKTMGKISIFWPIWTKFSIKFLLLLVTSPSNYTFPKSWCSKWHTFSYWRSIQTFSRNFCDPVQEMQTKIWEVTVRFVKKLSSELYSLLTEVNNIIITINIKDWTLLILSVSRVTAVRTNASSVSQLFSFLVVCSGMISKGFGFVAFFASVNANSVCIHLSCLVCL